MSAPVTTIQLEIPAEVMTIVKACAVVQGVSVEKYILERFASCLRCDCECLSNDADEILNAWDAAL